MNGAVKDRIPLSLKDIGVSARKMYLIMQHDELLLAWDNSDDDEKQEYPDAGLSVAEVYIYRDNYATATDILGAVEHIYQVQNNQFGLARVYLIYASILIQQTSITEAQSYIKKCWKQTNDSGLCGEANLLMGEIQVATDARKALDYYQLAVDKLSAASIADPLYKHNLAYVSFRLANAAYMQDMRDLAAHYFQKGESLLSQIGESVFASQIFMQLAHQKMQSGDFKASWQYLEAISPEHYKNPVLKMRIHSVKPYMAWMAGDDTSCLQELIPAINQNTNVLLVKGLNLLVQSYFYLTSGEFDLAGVKFREGQLCAGDHYLLKSRYQILYACIRALKNEATRDDLRETEVMQYYFRQNAYRTELVQSLLVSAWLAKLLGEEKKVKLYLQDCVDICRRTGSISHIYRYFQMARPYLLDDWNTLKGVEKVNANLDTFERCYRNGLNGRKTRLYGFGKPYLRVGDEHTIRGSVKMKYVLYMVEQKSATREQLLEMLWPGDDEKAAVNKFGVLRNEISTVLQEDWFPYSIGERLYDVKEGFPGYYDVHAFEYTIKLAEFQNDPQHELYYYRQALSLYRGDFARGIEGDFFEQKRQEYRDRRQDIRARVQELSKNNSDAVRSSH